MRALWLEAVDNATRTGNVDGIFADHSAQEHIQIGAPTNGQGKTLTLTLTQTQTLTLIITLTLTLTLTTPLSHLTRVFLLADCIFSVMLVMLGVRTLNPDPNLNSNPKP